MSDPTPTTPTNALSDGRSDAPLLEIRDLAISFAQPRPAVNSIGVTVERGEIVALVGESGSGKSMTARAILGLLPDGARASGSIRIAGQEVLGVSESQLRSIRGSVVSLVFQEPQSALNPVRTVGWQIRQALSAHGRVPRAEGHARAIELLRQVEIPEPEKRVVYYPHQLSGGQKQRVAIALALANDPELLLADEPTTALDVTVQEEVLALLDRIRARTGMAILLITHNMGVVAKMADRVAVLQFGDVVETAETGTIFRHPQHPYTQQLLAAVPRLPDVPEPTLSRHVVEITRTEAPVVSFHDIEVTYPGHLGGAPFTAVKNVSLELHAGEVVGLVGESGSGKTTLGRVAAGLVAHTGGDVRLEGQSLRSVGRQRLRKLRRDLAFVHQDPAASLDPRLSIADSIREPLDVHAIGTRRERDARVDQLLEAVQLGADHRDRRPHELSGGQRQRVALARALTLKPRLLVADEPTSALDVSVQAEVLELFAELQHELQFACLFISHDLAVVHQVADRVAILSAGELVESGRVGEVFTRPKHDYTRTLLAAAPVPDPAFYRATTPTAVAQ